MLNSTGAVQLSPGGRGVPQDDAAASRWFRLAAEQGEAFAQYNLGSKYTHGEGVPQDDVSAHIWLNVGELQRLVDASAGGAHA